MNESYCIKSMFFLFQVFVLIFAVSSLFPNRPLICKVFAAQLLCTSSKLDRDKVFSHMRLRTPTGSRVLDRSIRDGDLARGIHALLRESKQNDATLIVGIVPLRL